MAAPVWVLSVDLQTRTATFQTGMADAAKAARSSFGEIRDGAKGMAGDVGEASGRVNYSMMEARHGVMMLGEEFGVHLPRGLTTFIASLGPVGAAMEMAFPFLAIILGATLLIEKITKIGEAAEKAAQAGQSLNDDLALGINKAKEGMIDAEIEIRKLAGEPAWDLLAEKLKLKDADEGIENIRVLDKALDDLLKGRAAATSNWNPLNWGDHSDDTANKAKALQEQMRGKSQTEQTGVLTGALQLQTKIYEQMKGQTDVSAAQLKNQAAYVDFLQKESELIQGQADKAALADQAKQGKDRADKIAKEEEEQNKKAAAQQRGMDKRFQIEAEYAKKVAELHKKTVAEDNKLIDEQYAATVAVTKEIVEQGKERARMDEEIGKEEAEHSKKMAALELNTANEQTKALVKVKKSQSQQILDAKLAAENADYQATLRGYQVELAALDKNGKEFELKQKQLDDRMVELTKEHENKITQIKISAQEERNARVIGAEKRMDDALASGMMRVLQGHESAGKMLTGIGQQIAAGMMETAIKSVLANDFTKESDAAAAARKAYLAGMHFPFPVNVVMGPALAAAAFASVMAFETGGIVPGVEKGDVVPARLTPGEGVIPKPLMDNLKSAASNGSMAGSNGDSHFHYSPTQHFHALDQSGMKNVLDKHADAIEQHVENVMRRRNM
jgi:hypothetical protein